MVTCAKVDSRHWLENTFADAIWVIVNAVTMRNSCSMGISNAAVNRPVTSFSNSNLREPANFTCSSPLSGLLRYFAAGSSSSSSVCRFLVELSTSYRC